MISGSDTIISCLLFMVVCIECALNNAYYDIHWPIVNILALAFVIGKLDNLTKTPWSIWKGILNYFSCYANCGDYTRENLDSPTTYYVIRDTFGKVPFELRNLPIFFIFFIITYLSRTTISKVWFHQYEFNYINQDKST